jgi:hypothetical protein
MCEGTPSQRPSGCLASTIVARSGRSKGVRSSWNPVLVQGAIATAIAPSGAAMTMVFARSKRNSAVRGQTLSHCRSVQADRLFTSSW